MSLNIHSLMHPKTTCYKGDFPAKLSHRDCRCCGHNGRDEDENAPPAAVAEKGGDDNRVT